MRTHASFRAFVALTATVTVWGAASATSLAEPSAGDSKIAFIRDGDLYVMNADGSAAKRLAPDTGLSLHFAWSEDGSRLAFVQQYDDPKPPYRHYPGDIYVMQSDGRDVRRITRRRAVNAEEITWSPDGRWLGYARSVETCNFCGEWPLEAIAVNSLSGNERRIAPKVSSSLAPQWSPTAPSIAFIGQRRGSPISLYITREDGARLHRLTNADAVRPSWSPDGRTLLYLRDDSIRSIGITGSAPRRLAHGVFGYDGPPFWSPDGQHILFARDSDVWVMNADGTRERRLTSGKAVDSEPSWSPDGSQVAFTRYTDRGDNNSIYVIAGDGSGLRRLTRGPYDDEPAWQPRRP